MSIVRFDPFADLLTNGRWVPAVDIYENGKQELVLKAELPDMKREEIDARNKAEAEAYQTEQAAKAAAAAPQADAPKPEGAADGVKDGEVIDAEFAETR